MNDDRKVEIKIANKLLIEHAFEKVEATKGIKEDLRKINQVRKCGIVCLPHELIGSSGVTLKHCSKDACQRRIARCGIIHCDVVKFNKPCSEACINFIQWLRHNRLNALKDFKSNSEQKWQHGDQSNELKMKNDDDEHDEHDQDKSKLQHKVFNFFCAKHQLSAQSHGTLAVFQTGNLRKVDSD